MHDFYIYTGAISVEDSFGSLSGETVVKLCLTLTKDHNHLIFFDNYFNFIELSLKLAEHSFLSCGLIRRDRLRGFHVTKEAEMKKKDRGSLLSKKDVTADVTGIQWFYNKYVLLTSFFC